MMGELSEKHNIFTGEGVVVCPGCGETLVPADVEAYASCPYCDYQFERDARFDDFIVSPLVKGWMKNAHRQFPG